MKEFTTIWSRDFFTKFAILITWISLLILINYTIRISVQTRNLPYLVIFLTLALGLIYYNMMRIIRWVKYDFSKAGINIIITPKRKYFLSKETID